MRKRIKDRDLQTAKTALLPNNTSTINNAKKLIHRIGLFLFFCNVHNAQAMDNAHWYRARYFFGEPRFEKAKLLTIEATVGCGKTHHGTNSSDYQCPLLDTWGTQNITALAKGVKTLPPDNPFKLLSQEVDQKNKFVSGCARFTIIEAQIQLIRNFHHGFFSQLHIPVRSLEFKNVCFKDCTPATAQTVLWQNIYSNLTPLLREQGICLDEKKSRGFGDMSLLIGWALNYEQTKTADFVDFTIKTGLLAPTGNSYKENCPLQLPLGYNKQWAIPLSATYAIGFFEWLTIGLSGDSLFFFDRTKKIRMKTDPAQSGIFKLATGKAKISAGTLWNAGGYCKIDHAGGALSLLLGYSYSTQVESCICPSEPGFEYTIVNSDEQYRSWHMHTLHLHAEYDFSTEEKKTGTRIGLFYNSALGGKKIFKTGIFGGSLGIDIQAHW